MRVKVRVLNDWFIFDMSQEVYDEFKRWVTYDPCLKPDEAGYEKPHFNFVNNDGIEVILFRDKIQIIEAFVDDGDVMHQYL